MRIDLGMTVYASDGEKVGTVEKIVLDAERKAVDKLIVHHGMLSHRDDKLVDVDMIARGEDDALYLDLPSSEFKELSAYIEDEFVVATRDDVRGFPFITPNAGGAGSFLFGTPTAGREYEGASSGSIFAPANPVPPVVETRDNLRDVDVVIDKGTDVVGSDGKKVGTVGEVFFGAGGAIEGFMVSGGLFKQDTRLPINLVRETGSDKVLLSVPADEAATRGYDVDDTTL